MNAKGAQTAFRAEHKSCRALKIPHAPRSAVSCTRKMGKFRSVFITALAAFLVTVKPAFGQEKAYTSSWAVQITGGAEKADEIAEKYGFENLGLVNYILC